jgi:hypothetical protein
MMIYVVKLMHSDTGWGVSPAGLPAISEATGSCEWVDQRYFFSLGLDEAREGGAETIDRGQAFGFDSESGG